jgi:hypothetical protein
MDVYEILFQKCLEYEVLLDDKKVPLWKLKKEDIDKVNLSLPWENLQDLAIYLYELKKEQQRSKELIKCDISEILVGIAFLKSKKSGSLIADETLGINTCLNYLSELITARINCITRYYYLMKKPHNTDIFDEIILKFPQKKDVRAKNINDLKEIVYRLKDYFK